MSGKETFFRDLSSCLATIRSFRALELNKNEPRGIPPSTDMKKIKFAPIPLKKNAMMGYPPTSSGMGGVGSPMMNSLQKADKTDLLGAGQSDKANKATADAGAAIDQGAAADQQEEAAEPVEKSEDFINLPTANIPGKRLKNVGQAGKVPDGSVDDVEGDEGSGGKVTPMNKSQGVLKKIAPIPSMPLEKNESQLRRRKKVTLKLPPQVHGTKTGPYHA